MNKSIISLPIDEQLWERVYMAHSLVVIGSKCDGGYDLAPKHMAIPLGWENYFGFICTPRHQTYHNIKKYNSFTVSYPRPDSVVLASITAAPRCGSASGGKPIVDAVSTMPSTVVDGIFIEAGYCFFECELDRVVDGFGGNSLIAGKIVAMHVDKEAVRIEGADNHQLLQNYPLMVYLYPDRYAVLEESNRFPFPMGFKR